QRFIRVTVLIEVADRHAFDRLVAPVRGPATLLAGLGVDEADAIWAFADFARQKHVSTIERATLDPAAYLRPRRPARIYRHDRRRTRRLALKPLRDLVEGRDAFRSRVSGLEPLPRWYPPLGVGFGIDVKAPLIVRIPFRQLLAGSLHTVLARRRRLISSNTT